MTNFISGIYNYCDRWCERCTMTSHCRVFDQNEIKVDQTSDENERFFQKITDSFQETMDLIKKNVEEQGVDWEVFKDKASKLEIKEPVFSPKQLHLEELTRVYLKESKQWMSDRQVLVQEKKTELNQKLDLGIAVAEKETNDLFNALEVIQWYLIFISAKVNRALNGLHDKWTQEESPIQNDANGSAKIALIAVDQSIASWEMIRSYFPEETDELLDMLVLLTNIRKGILLNFPNALLFIRPGFDKIPEDQKV